MGRFTIAAKHHIDIAEIFESDSTDIDKVIEHYQKAADYYQGEESNSSANKCLLKVAQYSAQRELFENAAQIYEQLGTSSMDNALLRHGAKDHFFRAAICRMCQDLQDGANAIIKYEQMCPTFTDSRECKLLKTLLTACESSDVESFTDALREYDSISRLDPWHTSLLLRIKKSIESDSDLR
jgi:alpha-soluble NSF attachment protein